MALKKDGAGWPPVTSHRGIRYTFGVRIIVNPAAAGGRLGREWKRLGPKVRGFGLDAPYVMTEAPGHATELAVDAVGEGVGTIIAAGGDGTVCEVVEGLHRAGGGRLAILPLGTGNDAARTLGIPLRLPDAVRTILAGRTRRIDLLSVDGRVVLNAIGAGLTGEINRRAAAIKMIRGIAVYMATAVASLFSYRAPEVRLDADGRSWQGTMTMLAVHNGPTTGGGFRLTPAARPADGLLDVCLVEGMGVLRRVTRLVAGLRGRLGRMPGTLELQTASFDLSFNEPIPVHLDGNQWELKPPRASFAVLPGALEVVADSRG